MREDFENWWEKEGQYSELCGKELCIIAWSNGEYKAFKELTDKEIVSLYESSYLQSGLDEWEFDPVYFARAILKKAMQQ
jgi:hypothetical protein